MFGGFPEMTVCSYPVGDGYNVCLLVPSSHAHPYSTPSWSLEARSVTFPKHPRGVRLSGVVRWGSLLLGSQALTIWVRRDKHFLPGAE